MGIAAAAQTPFTKEPGHIPDMLLEAASQMPCDTADCILISTNDTTRYLAAVLADLCGITPRISGTIENMCSSGGSALLTAYAHVRAGLAKSVLVAGAENPGSPGAMLNGDITRGQYRHPIYWGSILTRSYMRRYGTTREELAAVAAKNRTHATDNPYALRPLARTIHDVLESPYVTDDLSLLDCSQPCAGSAAILVADEHTCRDVTDDPIWISGLAQYTAPAGFALGEHHTIQSARHAASEAYRMAGIAAHDIDVAEIHDAFSVCEPMILESLGMAGPGSGAALAADLYRTGSRKINPRGGILGSGHPLGATGVAQAVEMFAQLRGDAERRQVEGARTGVIQGMSAAGTGSVVMVMRS